MTHPSPPLSHLVPHLAAHHVHVQTPLGRTLFRDLDVKLGHGDRVAIVGRNGSGKSTLLRVLMGDTPCVSGRVTCTGARLLVPQLEPAGLGLSPGQERRLRLDRAFAKQPNFLLLDEPSLDLDRVGVQWLVGALRRFPGACVVVSHDRRVLRLFDDFFVVAESGCHHHHGDFDSLLSALARQHEHNEHKYLQRLGHHIDKEAEHVRIERSRARQQAVGRVRELDRRSARARLNAKRSDARASFARRSHVQAKSLGAAREWVKALRRSLAVQLPLKVTFPALPAETHPLVDARRLAFDLPSGLAVPPIDLRLSRQRWALGGANGCGKSTLLRTLLGEHPKTHGTLRTALHKMGYIAQNAANWQHAECLLEYVCEGPLDLERAAAIVAAHHFPIALAERPLSSLSPGERVRAALLALCERRPLVEFLVLDEPTNHLDLMATTALERVLRAWPGGLLVVSHDREFLRNIGVTHDLHHTQHGWRLRSMASGETLAHMP